MTLKPAADFMPYGLSGIFREATFPGMAVWQVYKPLLSDPNPRNSFQRHGVIRPAGDFASDKL